MGLPARDEARNWVGWTVVDQEGAELGACTAVLADGFAVVAAIRAGLPGYAVAALALGVVAVGHVALGVLQRRLGAGLLPA